jgi:hypothetical protein
MPKFTGVRLEKFEELKVLRRFIGNALYKAEVAKLEKAEARAVAAAAAAAARREAKERAAEAVRAAKAREAAIARSKNKRLANLQKKFDAKQAVVLKLNDLRKAGISDKEILTFLAKQKGMWSLHLGDDQYYLLNDTTRGRLLDLITKNMIITEEFTESDGRIVQAVREFDTFHVTPIIAKNKNKKDAGAFFKYNHVTKFDLDRYGVFKNNDPENYRDTCLVRAFIAFGVPSAELEVVKRMVKNRVIPLCDLPKIADAIKMTIQVKTLDTKNNGRRVFGNYDKTIQIGLVDDHYFLIEPVNITSFAIKNYEEVCDLKDFNFIIKKQDDRYKRDPSRCIDSFDVIKLLLANKEKLLKEITMEDELIASTQFYDKVSTEITNLHYEGGCFPVEKPESRLAEPIIYKNVFFDFETDPNGTHKPYLCRTFDGVTHREFVGDKCGLYMLNSLTTHTRLIAHNATYDFRFLIEYLRQIKELSRGTRLISATGLFKDLKITIKDSYHLISMPLRNFPKVFGLTNTVKEVMPYSLYTQANIKKRFVPIAEALALLSEEDHLQFLSNVKRWNVANDTSFDIIKYSSEYCKIDCEILQRGYVIFRGWILEKFEMDIDEILTCASLAHRFFIKDGCYTDVYQISGTPQYFIQQCVVGGRVMCSENKKNFIESYVGNDFDATSLYPSAMSRMDGFLKGKPKVIENHSYDWLKQQDGYFVEIEITKVGIARKFPLMSYKNEDGVRTFTNEMVGRSMFVDKTTLEDLITFQDVQFIVKRGYYFNEGFNTKIKESIKYIFNKRLEEKKRKNPVELVYKLIMNSGYGKSIMKPVESTSVFFDREEEFNVYLSRNYNWVTSYVKFGNKIKVNLVKRLMDHCNIAHVGVAILSMSKRIMNEVMCLAEDKGLPIYYQDTDSMHLNDSDITTLSDAYRFKFGRELIGKNLGQFHSDFALDDCTDITCSRSIFLGKKCYIDELVGVNSKGEKEIGYHIRMKGIPEKVIEYAVEKTLVNGQRKYATPFDLYLSLYNGESIVFDLTNDGTKANFKMNKNYTIDTLSMFSRTVRF